MLQCKCHQFHEFYALHRPMVTRKIQLVKFVAICGKELELNHLDPNHSGTLTNCELSIHGNINRL